jgi:hypothetical protein
VGSLPELGLAVAPGTAAHSDSGEMESRPWGCSPEEKLTEAAVGMAGQRQSINSTTGVRRGDGSGRGKLKLSGGMGSGERHGAVL